MWWSNNIYRSHKLTLKEGYWVILRGPDYHRDFCDFCD